MLLFGVGTATRTTTNTRTHKQTPNISPTVDIIADHESLSGGITTRTATTTLDTTRLSIVSTTDRHEIQDKNDDNNSSSTGLTQTPALPPQEALATSPPRDQHPHHHIETKNIQDDDDDDQLHHHERNNIIISKPDKPYDSLDCDDLLRALEDITAVESDRSVFTIGDTSYPHDDIPTWQAHGDTSDDDNNGNDGGNDLEEDDYYRDLYDSRFALNETFLDTCNDSWLIPGEDLSKVFDIDEPNNKDDDESNSIIDNNLDTTAVSLLEQLGNLRLDQYNDSVEPTVSAGEGREEITVSADQETHNMTSNADKSNDETTENDIPSHLYCQPCLGEPPTLPEMQLFPPPVMEWLLSGGDTSDESFIPPTNPTNEFWLGESDNPDYEPYDGMVDPSLLSLLPEHYYWSEDLSEEPYSQLAPPDHANPTDHGYGRKPPQRPELIEALQLLTDSMGIISLEQDINYAQSTTKTRKPPTSERLCIGHKERIMGLDISACGRYLATASQDSTVRIWLMEANQQLAVLTDHSKKHECLRVAWASSSWAETVRGRHGDTKHSSMAHILATGGADGFLYFYGCPNPETSPWTCYASINHATLNHFAPTDDPDDAPQVYALQFIDHWEVSVVSETMEEDVLADNNSFLLSSSDDHIHLWELISQQKKLKGDGIPNDQYQLQEVLSIRMGDLYSVGYGVTWGRVSGEGTLPMTTTDSSNTTTQQPFGGPRNPRNLVYVFDASYSPANGLLGVALSDGSLRIVNGRAICLVVLQLPGVNAHLTSFSWDSSGTRLASCAATGHVITWRIDGRAGNRLLARCTAIFEGGHEVGRPLFGARFLGWECWIARRVALVVGR